MKTIEIKIEVSKDKDACKNAESASIKFTGILKGLVIYRTIKVKSSVNLTELKNLLLLEFKDDIEIRDGVSEGFYGGRTGRILKGFTVWTDSSLFPLRYIDAEFNEVVNIEQLCEEHGEKLEIDAESFQDTMEELGIKGEGDNTCNYLGNNYEDPEPLCGADFTVYNHNDSLFVVIKFHFGGDPRGNYTENVVYKFEDSVDYFNALYPRMELIDEDNAQQIAELKDQLWCLKGTARKSLIRQLEKLL